MPLINNETIHRIESIVYRIEHRYRNNKGLILTEDDLKCQIYGGLSNLCYRRNCRSNLHTQNLNTIRNDRTPFFRNDTKYLPDWCSPTRDQHITASPVHAEVPWYDENGLLTIRPDITILEPSHLSIIHGLKSVRLPSKQFEFAGQGIIFELKFCRYRIGISRHFLEKIREDYNKIEGLFTKLRESDTEQNLYCFYITFNKTERICQEFIEFMNSHGQGQHHKILYCTGRVNCH